MSDMKGTDKPGEYKEGDNVIIPSEGEMDTGPDIILTDIGRAASKAIRFDAILLAILAFAVFLIVLGLMVQNSLLAEFSTLLIFMGVLIAIAGAILRRSIWLVTRYDIPALNNPPTEEDTVTVPRHGTVHRGRTEVPLGGDRTRPYIWIWFDPAENSDCIKGGGHYRWYQYVNLELFIDGVKKKTKKAVKGGTELYYRFDEWNPDYHVKEAKKSDPDFTPDAVKRKGLLKDKLGKPFKQYDVPGTETGQNVQGSGMGMQVRGTHKKGILDAPDFCNRGDDKLSPIERLLGRFVKIEDKKKQQLTKPNPDQDVDVRVLIEARSYLVCTKDGKVTCIGYVPWTYMIDSRIKVSWSKSGKIAGGSDPVWTLGALRGPCTYTLTINDWVNGC